MTPAGIHFRSAYESAFSPLDGLPRTSVAFGSRKEVMRMDSHSRSYGRTLAQEVTSS